MFKAQQMVPNKLTAYSLVVVQVIILGLLIFQNTETEYSFIQLNILGKVFQITGIVAILVSAYSIRRSLTAVPLPKQGGQLATNGLYRYVRHPMYTSVMVFSLGLAFSSGEIYKYLLVIALGVLFYYKSIYEEKHLVYKYSDYSKYSEKTPRFFPKLK